MQRRKRHERIRGYRVKDSVQKQRTLNDLKSIEFETEQQTHETEKMVSQTASTINSTSGRV